jgi:asparagine synthase (glutamine-hydrolysing)
MCGICGIYNFDAKPVNSKLLMEMTRTLAHRGPDDEGFLLVNTFKGRKIFKKENQLNQKDTDYNLGLGHRRLSIIDLSPRGTQPMSNEDGSLWIVHNGEIYNYLELKEILEKKGHKFFSHTDTEVILHAYEEWQEACLKEFNGMWAFVIWDDRNKQLFCSRDRFGVKPFYYYFDDKTFIFASEIKPILCNNNIKRMANDKAVYDFIFHSLEDHTEDTFFKGIRRLSPGHYLEIKDGRFTQIKWWDLSHKVIEHKNIHEDFKQIFLDAVRIRLRSDVSIGSCLSGGLDSSSIILAAHLLLNKSANLSPKSFTACFKNKNIDERKYVDQILKQIKLDGYFVYPKPENNFCEEIKKLVWIQEEPFSTLSIYAQSKVMEEAKKSNLKVLLDGQGGDEVLLGYAGYYPLYLWELLKKYRFLKLIKEFWGYSAQHNLNLIKIAKNLLYFNLPLMRKLYKDITVKNYLKEDFIKNNLTDSNTYFNINNLRRIQKLDIEAAILPRLLRYEDKNSMRYSIETRLPFLDYRLVELVFNAPYEDKLKAGWTKHILRQTMKGILPEAIRLRKGKVGFLVPEEDWMQRSTSHISELIDKNSIISKVFYLKKLKDALQENRLSANLKWKIFNLILWQEIYKVNC